MLGILAYFFYAISTSIDKYFMKKGHHPNNVNAFKMFFDGIILLIIGFLFLDLNFSFKLIFWSFLLGGMYAISGNLYFRSLKLRDARVITPYYQSLIILIVFISSIIFFEESVNFYNIIGISFILIGVYTILSKNGIKIPKLDTAIFLISIAIIIDSIYFLLVKKLLFDFEPINLAITVYFSSALVLFFFMFFSKKQRMSFDIKSSKIIISAFFGAIATFLIFTALSIGNASKVYPLAGIQSVFLFIIATIFLKEKFQWHKLIGVLIVVLGIYLVSL